ncbi:MAG: hypothetical protein M3O91_08970 [Chloroflexota bacterium]|nr:hypothetical protein [Chloroflexota bacterium]
MRATYTRKLGTETFLGFYDVHADVLGGIFRKRKRLREIEEAFRRLRSCYPHRRLYVILDNLHMIHDHPRFHHGREERRKAPSPFTASRAARAEKRPAEKRPQRKESVLAGLRTG